MPGMTGGRALENPLVGAHYYVTVTGFLDNEIFRECSGIGSESEVIEYKASTQGDYHSIQAIPGRLKWNKINLKRGLTKTKTCWEWRRMVEEGKVETARASGTIVMVDQEGTPVAAWEFVRGWPSKLQGPSLNASQSDAAVEELEITHEGLIRTAV